MRVSLLAPTALLALCAGAHGRAASELTPLKQTAPSLLALRGGGPGVEVSAKTFLPQKSFGFGLWKNGMRVHLNNESTLQLQHLTHACAIAGFETWHIDLFVAGLVGGNYALLATGLMGRPTPGALPLDALLQPSNPTFKLFLLTTALLFAKTHLVMWAQVWLGCKHNRSASPKHGRSRALPLSHSIALSLLITASR